MPAKLSVTATTEVQQAKAASGVESHADRLRKQVEAVIETEPVECEAGFRWAMKPQEWWCQQLGVSPATIRKITNKPPFVKKRRKDQNGEVRAMLRIGEPGPDTDWDRTNELARLWRKRRKRDLNTKAIKCLWGLVKAWPEGRAPELLAVVLDDWDQFMAGVKQEMHMLVETGQPGKVRYYEYPSITVVRRFHYVAVEMLIMKEQEARKPAHDLVEWLNAWEDMQKTAWLNAMEKAA